MWRFLASALSYLFFYFVIGRLNYRLVTQPYYESHAGGLTVPPAQTILAVESVRCLFIVFSVFLFLLSVRGNKHQLMISAGWLLFASAVEIFFQNFSTGAVAAFLMGIQGERQTMFSQVPLRERYQAGNNR